MTDKIIIDGCNVSGCEHYKTGDCLISPVWCDQFYNCDYKQLKRNEKECEELKKQYNCYACDTCKGKEDYINLKRHCENAIKSLHNKQAEHNQLKADREEALKQLEFVRTLNTVQEAENRKLSKTLEEIKEIAEAITNGTHFSDDVEAHLKEMVNKILQKIKEVEDSK